MLWKYTLTNDELSHIIDLSDNITPKRNKTFHKKFAMYKGQDKYTRLVSIGKKYASKSDIEYKNKCAVEFHKISLFGEKFTHPFDWHYDDYGAVSYCTLTVLFYIRKDKTVKGGDLMYMRNNTKEKCNIQVGDVVVLNGGLKHSVENMSGTGCRDVVVLFFERK